MVSRIAGKIDVGGGGSLINRKIPTWTLNNVEFKAEGRAYLKSDFRIWGKWKTRKWEVYQLQKSARMEGGTTLKKA